MLLSKRFLSLLLALLLLFCAAPFSAQARSYQDAHPGQSVSSSGFIATTACEQFELSTDRNTFGNDSASFFMTWYLSAPFLNKLLLIGSYSEQCALMRMTESFSYGSCFGMSATMVLNRLTQQGKLADADKLYISEYAPAARQYVDLPLPKRNLPVQDMINYYQVGQMLSSTVTPNTISASNETGAFDRGTLARIVNSFKADIDTETPCLFSLYINTPGASGAHAVVGVDYYEYSESGKDYIILKLYDENCVVTNGASPACWFSWIRLDKMSDAAYAPVSEEQAGATERILYHRYDGNTQMLSIIRYRDIVQMNQTFNIHHPQSKLFTPTNAFLSVKDINNTYARYAIKPVKALTNGFFGDAVYTQSHGVFFVQSDGDLPRPMDASDMSRVFPHMQTDELQYEAVSGANARPPFTPTDVRVSLLPSGEGADFAAFDVVCSSGRMNVSMSKTADASGAGQYADVAGDALQLARFQPDGTLRYLKAAEGQEATDVSLYFGAKDMSGTLDMLKLNMARLGFLKLYSGADSPAYNGSVVLHANSLTNAMDFTFYKGVRISDTIPFHAATADETWIKIMAQPAGDKVNVTVWTDSDPTSGGVPLPDGTNGAPFSKPPVFTTVLHERTGNPSGIFDPDAYNNQSRYSLNDGAETLPYNGGDLQIKTNGASERFVSVSIDGVMVERGFVTVGADGSITIAEAFMQTLSDGTHRLRVQYTDGYLETTLVKNAHGALQPVAAVPATGGSASAPIALLAAAVALFLAVLILKRRK